jgi:hypothetical protein
LAQPLGSRFEFAMLQKSADELGRELLLNIQENNAVTA